MRIVIRSEREAYHAVKGKRSYRKHVSFFASPCPRPRVKNSCFPIAACALLALALPAPVQAAAGTPFGALAPTTRSPAPTLGKLAIQLLAHEEAAKAGVPYDLIDAVIKIESDYQPSRIGDVGEIGLMQVRLGTAALMGFRGATTELSEPATNIHYGATYLGAAWRLAEGNVCRTLMKYRAGHGEESMSQLSASYCARARAHLAAIGSPLAVTIKDADLQIAAGASSNSGQIGRPRVSAVFWVRFEKRIAAKNAAIEAKWKHMAAR